MSGSVRSVMVFAGLDPSGGAGIAADLGAIAAQGVHALPLVTALTVQDQDRVYEVVPVETALLERQAGALLGAVAIHALKIGIPGSLANAELIAGVIEQLRRRHPALPVVLDPVLASGHGDALGQGDARTLLAPLLPLATVVVPNLMEAAALDLSACANVLETGGHGEGPYVYNRWLGAGAALEREWRWPRLAGAWHGTGCTLASALAARLALGEPLAQAADSAQAYVHRSLEQAFSIGPGQQIPRRFF